MRASAVVVCLAASVAIARADEIDVQQQAYVDVIDTTDGSSWVGALVEEVPGDHYKLVMADGSVRLIKAADVVKITKRKNPAHAMAMPAAMPAAAPVALLTCAPTNPAVVTAPPPQRIAGGYLRSGLQVAASVDMIFPLDDISALQTSYAPEVRVGYEQLYGRIGLSAGGFARYAYWILPETEDKDDAAWTLETHAYGQAAYHLDRAAILAGTSLGLDSNYVSVDVGTAAMSKTSAGFGMNLFAGFELDYLRDVALSFMFDYHPATDTIVSGAPGSISYIAATGGALVRL